MSVRKFLIILSIVTILALGAGFVYYFMFLDGGQGSFTEDGAETGIDSFPFGESSGGRDRGDNNTSNESNTGGDDFGSINPLTGEFLFKQISKEPVSGSTFTLDSEKVRFSERSTGHIYDFDIENQETSRVSNTTTIRAFSAIWDSIGDVFLTRTIDEETGFVDSSLFVLNQEEGWQKNILPRNIKSVDISMNSSIIYSLGSISNGVSFFKTSVKQKSAEKIYSSNISEWNLDWINNRSVLATTKPSDSVDGFVYKLDTVSKSFSKVLGPKGGLVAKMSPDENWLLYSSADRNGIETRIYNTNSGVDTLLNIKTIADKCVWTSDSEFVFCAVPNKIGTVSFPDAWYKGEVSFADSLYQVIPERGDVEFFVSFSEVFNEDIDLVEPKINENNTIIIFQNKKDLSLWGLRIKTEVEDETEEETEE